MTEHVGGESIEGATDHDRLLAAIRIAADRPDLGWAEPPRSVSGGFWAEILRVRLVGAPFGGRDLIMRIMPEADVAARETAVQSHLASVGFPTPAVHLSAPPGPDLDRAWMLMDLARGAPLLNSLSARSAVTMLPRLATALPDQLARHAATLHRIDVGSLIESSKVRVGVDDLLDETRAHAERVQAHRLVAALDRLAGDRPPAGQDEAVSICHGDLHPFNVLSHAEGDTVLDWTNARVTNPAFDVAHTRLLLTHPPLVGPGPVKPLIGLAGRMLARRFERTYRRLSNRPLDERQLEWHQELHRMRILTEVASWRHRGRNPEHADHPYGTMASSIDGGLLDDGLLDEGLRDGGVDEA